MRTSLLSTLTKTRWDQARKLKTKEDRAIATGIYIVQRAICWAEGYWAGIQVPCDEAYARIEQFASLRELAGYGLSSDLLPSWREWVDQALALYGIEKARVLVDGHKIRVFRRSTFDPSKIAEPRLDTDADLEALRWPLPATPTDPIFCAEGTDGDQCAILPQAS